MFSSIKPKCYHNKYNNYFDFFSVCKFMIEYTQLIINENRKLELWVNEIYKNRNNKKAIKMIIAEIILRERKIINEKILEKEYQEDGSIYIACDSQADYEK